MALFLSLALAAWGAVLAGFRHPEVSAAWGKGSDVWVVGSAWDPDRPEAKLPTISLLMHSADGGQTWDRIPGKYGSIDGIWGNGDLLVAVGHGILRSADGGKSWVEIELDKVAGVDKLPNWFSLQAVTGAGADVWAVGCEVGGFGNPAAVLHSGDSGKTWAVQKHGIEGCPGGRIWSPGGGDVVAVGRLVTEEATIAMVLSTRDGGKHWQRSLLKAVETTLDRIGGTRGEIYVTASGLDPPRTFRSRDGGTSWKPSASAPLLLDRLSWQDGDKVYTLDPATGRVTRRN